MPRAKPKGILERSAADDLWKHTLSRIPAVFGKLAYLASLRDTNSGAYRHHGLTSLFGREESVRALRESHEQAFLEWIGFPLAEKSRDLEQYFAGLEESRETVVEHWLRSRIYATYAPGSARTMERELFLSDLEALLQTIRNAAAESAQPSSQPS
jgi:hypothetical protein